MNDDQRAAVCSNAKYLRAVRPIDPEEIYEYVDGQPHPAAVRQVLREEAIDLELRETEDGTFVPIDSGPVDVDSDGVDAFPERYARVLEDLLVDRYGPGWPEGDSGDRIRERIRAFKDAYLHGDEVAYDEETALAYAIYHLPDYYATTQHVLAELARDGLLEQPLRVLDVGAGVGGPVLGLADLFDGALVDYHAVEPSAAAEVLERLLERTGRNFHSTVHRETAEAFDPEGQFDLVVFGNVLSELSDPGAVVEKFGNALDADGSILALAPADRNTAIDLRHVERAVADDGPCTVYAPTMRLWPGERPTDEMWSFDSRPDLEVPPFQRRLQEGAGGDVPATDDDSDPTREGEFVNVDVQYAYSVLRRDGQRRIEVSLDRESAVAFADTESVVTKRVDCYAIKLSHDLADGGNPLFRIGDGSQPVGHFAVLTDPSILNEDLVEAAYGDLLVFENVLVLWNEDEEAYNLVVDAETVVDSVRA